MAADNCYARESGQGLLSPFGELVRLRVKETARSTPLSQSDLDRARFLAPQVYQSGQLDDQLMKWCNSHNVRWW